MKIYIHREQTDAAHVGLGGVFRGHHTDFLIKVEPYDDMVLAYELRSGRQVKLEQNTPVDVFPDAVIRSL